MRKKPDRRLAVWLTAALVILILCIVWPHFLRHDPYEVNLLMVNSPPCREYIMGTDYLGRCIFCRIVTGAGRSVFAALAVVAICFTVGTLIGSVCGYIGGVFDLCVMRFTDAFQAFPQLVFTISVAAMLGPGMRNCIIAMSLTGWTGYARLARSSVMELKEQEYVSAARLSGMSRTGILFRMILPNGIAPLVVSASMHVGNTILGFAGLSFLGLGTAPPYPEWGAMMNDGRAALQTAPWGVIFPGLAIMAVVMVMGLLGDALNRHMDPKSTDRRRRKRRKYEKTFKSASYNHSGSRGAVRVRQPRGVR